MSDCLEKNRLIGNPPDLPDLQSSYLKESPTVDFRDAVFDTIRTIMRQDPSVVITTNDMNAMLLDQIREEMPDRVINIGIAEQNLISVSGGLAQAGKKVFVFGIVSHVIGRGWEQIKLDVCTMKLPVVILGVGPGLSYGNDGPTHHGTEDVALTRVLPNMTVLNPCDSNSMIAAVKQAHALNGPAYIRIDRENIVPIHEDDADLTPGLRVWREGTKLALVTTGVITHRVLDATDRLRADGIDCQVVELYRLKPTSSKDIVAAIGQPDRVVVVEEHSPVGGVATIVAESLVREGIAIPMETISLPDEFLLGSASRDWAHETYGLSATKLKERLGEMATIT